MTEYELKAIQKDPALVEKLRANLESSIAKNGPASPETISLMLDICSAETALGNIKAALGYAIKALHTENGTNDEMFFYTLSLVLRLARIEEDWPLLESLEKEHFDTVEGYVNGNSDTLTVDSTAVAAYETLLALKLEREKDEALDATVDKYMKLYPVFVANNPQLNIAVPILINYHRGKKNYADEFNVLFTSLLSRCFVGDKATYSAMKEFFVLTRFLFENEEQTKETALFLNAGKRFETEFDETADGDALYSFFLENFGREDDE